MHPNFKRAHRKSRNGCTSCKQRRVKCDETRPICLTCERRGSECVYVKPGIIRRPRLNHSAARANEKEPASNSKGVSTIADTADNNASTTGQLASKTPESLDSGLSGSNDLLSTIDFGYGLGNFKAFDSPFTNQSEFNLDLFNSSFPTDLMQLTSNCQNGKNLVFSPSADTFPKEMYLTSTAINNRLSRYYSDSYYARLAPSDKKVSQSWKTLIIIGYQKEYLYHIVMAVVLMDIYHKAIDNGSTENILSFENINDYLKLSDVNYKEYLRTTQTVAEVSREGSICGYLSSAVLHLVYFLLNPAMSMFDPNFFDAIAKMAEVYSNKAIEGHDYEVSKITVAELRYYSPYQVPQIRHKQDVYFPSYLYLLVDVPGNKMRSGWSATGNFQQQMIDEKQSVLNAVNILKNEYHLVYNEEEPEKDAFRVFLRFPMLVPPDFVDMLVKQDQRCAIIMAHYLMLLASLPFNKLIPLKCLRIELQNLNSIIDDDWRSWLDVPKRALGLL